MEYITLDVTILLIAAVFGIILSQKFGQSIVVGEILLGVLIGPTVLGWVSYSEPVRVLAELGAFFMLFTIGLESKLEHIFLPKNFLVAFGGVIVPFGVGWFVSNLFGLPLVESLFVAAALTATSVAITAKILQERGLLDSSIARTIIGAAVIDDILSLAVLSIITSYAKGSLNSALVKIGFAILFIILVLLLIKTVNRILLWLAQIFSQNEHIILFSTMIVAFGYAAIAQIIGLSSIVGAFLAGVTLKKLENQRVLASVQNFELFFSAIFFVSIGVVINFLEIGNAWFFAVILLIIAAFTKFVGCFITSFVTKHSILESFNIGLGMIPRGEVAMIVGLIGLSAGIVTAPIYSAVVFMAFFTTILTPILLSRTLPKTNK